MRLTQLFPLSERFLSSHYDQKKSRRMLADRGWQPTTIENEYKHPDAPQYSVELDLYNLEGKGPFTVYRGSRKIAQLSYPPYATHLNLRK